MTEYLAKVRETMVAVHGLTMMHSAHNLIMMMMMMMMMMTMVMMTQIKIMKKAKVRETIIACTIMIHSAHNLMTVIISISMGMTMMTNWMTRLIDGVT